MVAKSAAAERDRVHCLHTHECAQGLSFPSKVEVAFLLRCGASRSRAFECAASAFDFFHLFPLSNLTLASYSLIPSLARLALALPCDLPPPSATWLKVGTGLAQSQLASREEWRHCWFKIQILLFSSLHCWVMSMLSRANGVVGVSER